MECLFFIIDNITKNGILFKNLKTLTERKKKMSASTYASMYETYYHERLEKENTFKCKVESLIKSGVRMINIYGRQGSGKILLITDLMMKLKLPYQLIHNPDADSVSKEDTQCVIIDVEKIKHLDKEMYVKKGSNFVFIFSTAQRVEGIQSVELESDFPSYSLI